MTLSKSFAPCLHFLICKAVQGIQAVQGKGLKQTGGLFEQPSESQRGWNNNHRKSCADAGDEDEAEQTPVLFRAGGGKVQGP